LKGIGERDLSQFNPPLCVFFLWHFSDSACVQPLIKYCEERLQRHPNNPFSRSLNIPLFLNIFKPDQNETRFSYDSSRVIVFLFVSKELAADSSWKDYISQLSKESFKIVPIALDNSSIKAKTPFSNLNFIRLYDFKPEYRETRFFIAVTHEIYRFTLNPQYNQLTKGKENAIRLFLSHAKADDWAVKLARSLKEFIDDSAMRNFFDATDIAPAYRFDREIRSYIGESTLISIHSDNYSSRYWCQQEILCAKQKLRPIIIVDHLKDSEDRSFPYAGNVPAVHVTPESDVQIKDLYRILEAALMETIRFFYQVKLLKIIEKSLHINRDTIALARPPESADLTRFIRSRKGNIEKRINSVLYPEPPVYPDELKFLQVLGIKAFTPITAGHFNLRNYRIGLSISDVGDSEIHRTRLPSNQLKLFAQDLARHLLARGSRLIYGGDLRKDGFTEFLFSEASSLRDRLQRKSSRILNYIAWPIYLADSEDVKRWKADYSYVAEMKEILPPKDVLSLIHDTHKFLKPDSILNRYIWGRCLTFMREKMIQKSDVRICTGGRLIGYKGKYPGVLEEVAISMSIGKPLYLLGAYGGMTERICNLLADGQTPEELTLYWQSKNNIEYDQLIEEYKNRTRKGYISYTEIESIIKGIGLKGLCRINHLTEEENLRLFHTPFTEEAILLILTGISRITNIRK